MCLLQRRRRASPQCPVSRRPPSSPRKVHFSTPHPALVFPLYIFLPAACQRRPSIPSSPTNRQQRRTPSALRELPPLQVAARALLVVSCLAAIGPYFSDVIPTRMLPFILIWYRLLCFILAPHYSIRRLHQPTPTGSRQRRIPVSARLTETAECTPPFARPRSIDTRSTYCRTRTHPRRR